MCSSDLVLQAAAVFVALRYGLHLTFADPGGLALLLVLTGLTFTAINQSLVAAFGLAGRFLAMLVGVAQLAAAGGVYPAATTPAAIQALHPLLPMSHVVAAARSLIAGGMSNVFGAVAVLLMWLLGASNADQRKSIADYFKPSSHSMTPFGQLAGSNGVLGGRSIIDPDAFPYAARQTGLLERLTPRSEGGPIPDTDPGPENENEAPDPDW